MAHIYRATIRPTKLELLDDWAPSQPWFEGRPGTGTTLVASFRFDDPDGEVGMETLLVRAGGPLLQVPLTYRPAPLEGGEAWLITTMEHSVLGRRWVYDAFGDPVYRTALATTILTGGREADQYVEADGETVLREPTARVLGSGTEAALPEGEVHIEIVRKPDTDSPDLDPAAPGRRTEVLTGSWSEHGLWSEPRVLARVRF